MLRKEKVIYTWLMGNEGYEGLKVSIGKDLKARL